MRKIIITGGGFKNKGAQAMTFICVSELKRRFPNHQILLISDCPDQEFGTDLSNYRFDVCETFPLRFAQARDNFLDHLFSIARHGALYQKCREVYQNADLQIDISGYALGSNWEDSIVQAYLDKIEFAKAYKVPVIFPTISKAPPTTPETRDATPFAKPFPNCAGP